MTVGACGCGRRPAGTVHEPSRSDVRWEPGDYARYAVDRGGDAVAWRLPGIVVNGPPRPAVQSGLRLDQPTLSGVGCYRVVISGAARKTLSVLRPSAAHGRSARLPDLLRGAATPPTLAVAGSYFNVETNDLIGALVLEGRVVNRSGVGCTMTVDQAGEVAFVDADMRLDAPRYRLALGGGPRLLKAGRPCLETGDFHDPNVLGTSLRTVVGRTARGDLVVLVVPHRVNLGQAAAMLAAAGATEGMLLDGGACLTLFYDGEYLALPERTLTNLLTATIR